MRNPLTNISKKAAVWISISIVVVILIISIFGWANNMQKQSVEKEVRLSRTYESMKSDLDTFLSTAREQAGVTKAQSAAFDKIMLDAVSGRYQGKEGQPTSAQPGTGTLFSAIAEAYPNLDGINSSYNRILDTITSGRQTFNNGQKKLQDEIRSYDTWRKSGIIHSWALETFIGVPTDNLTITNGDQKFVGQAAYDKMSQVIQSGVTSQAFKTGNLEAQDFFGQ